jgi:dipeptidyl aminopeptidase/acylaminoacyl peptidase
MRTSRPLAAVALVALATFPGTPLTAQQDEAFVLLLASGDTVAVERFARSPDRLAAELLVRAAGARFTWAVTLAPDASVTRLENAFRAAGADRSAPPAQSAEITFTGDSAIAVITTGERTATQRLGTRRGAIPFINPSFALVEQVVRRAFVLGGDSVSVPTFFVQGGRTLSFVVQRVGTDSVVVDLGGAPARLAVSASGDILGGTVPAQGLRIVRTRGVSRGPMEVAPPDYSAPPGAPYVAEEVRIPAGGFTLAGTLTIPRDAPHPLPAVVTVTGSGSQDRDERIPLVPGYALFRQIADTLSRHGIAVLRTDDRGTGESEGDPARATSADFADDIRAGLRYLRGRREIDARRLGLIGHSEGGILAPMIAAEDSSLRGIVVMAGPAWTGRRVIESQNRYLLESSPDLSPRLRDSLLQVSMRMVDSAGGTTPWIRYFQQYDPLPVARRVRVPVLILHGATDRQVTAEQAEELGSALRDGGNRDVTVRVFERTNHLFLADSVGHWANYHALAERAVRPEVLGVLLDWATARFR